MLLTGLRTQPISDERRDRRSRRVPPADAERVARRVDIDLVPLCGVEVTGLEQPGTEPDRRLVRGARIFDVQIDMHLLRSPVRPVGWNVVRRELYADMPLAGGVDDAVKPVVPEDVPAEHPRPERALGLEIGSIEHDYLAHHLHWPERSGQSGCVGVDQSTGCDARSDR